ncbi:PREDICTED: uncharacterized protein At1g08160-like [Ipomoea nil]|uniref:uncharacterized protein At1g08160-like n=1 Tax=Ipomoea nil TaxID=35883 RepID=UPI000901B165|nr:PREDICTED: uncharacterized protein At1g08160-like [Ipomoea nil]
MPAPSSASRARRFSLVRCLTTCFSTLVILTGAIILIVWLAIRPNEIDYTVDNASVRNYNFSDDRLSADFTFTIKAKNPNAKVSLYYDSINASLSYDLYPIGSASGSPFYQRKKSTREFELVFPTRRAVLPDVATRDLKNQSSTAGKVAVDLTIYAKIRFKVWFVKSSHFMKVVCSPINVPLSNKGFQPEFCDVFM